MGMSAGYYLAKRGLKTLLLDAFDPPHTEGSHHGEPRLIRHAYSGGPAYISLALRAHRLWDELEGESGEQLLEARGVLNMADPEQYSYRTRAKEAAGFGIPVEMLDAVEVRKRWPGINLPDHYEAMYEPTAGYLYSEKCVAAYRRLALAAGAELLPYTPVERIAVEAGGSASVHTRSGVFHADRVIVSAGAWFWALEPFVKLPIRAVRKAVGWFEAKEELFAEQRFPGFTFGGPGGGYYGFPSIGGAGVKIGRHDGGNEWRPGEPLEPFGSYSSDEGDLRSTLEAYMPQAAGKLLRGAVCKYELTPDESFIIDRHPEHPGVLLAGGFSGHGFKFASAVGEILADLAEKGKTGHDISLFALARFDKETVA
ncbi:methyltryptophan oxidase [Paenibacillus beijingensis]|uniref:Methyltryptophan oxidase n=2 Tax=Paenibacillus beijingensis TaxID=1126833 RepID=A0A0D5NFI0_9BACL|nr:methyltryptophan oxidase [Paenibacillus beijingensis]